MFWATVEPVGTAALFGSLTAGMENLDRKRTARKAIGYASIVLLGSILVGQIVLSAMGIKLISLQVAGGCILFLFGLQMVFGDGGTSEARAQKPESGHDIAVFPLALPSIASPGAIMAAILLTDNNLYSVLQQARTTLALLLVLFLTWVFMIASRRLFQAIGRNGSALVVKIMGMILAALSVELIMSALGVDRWLGS